MSNDAQPPYARAYWVIPGSLLAGAYPGGTDEASTVERMQALLDVGIHSVIDLMTEEEILEHEDGQVFLPYEDQLEALGEERDVVVEIVRHGIEDGNTLVEQEMAMILDSIDAEIDGRSSPTLVHCSDGHGRTGMVIGCYLARHGIANGKPALEKIKELRSLDPQLAEHRSPVNMVEEKFVLRWKQDQ